MTAAGVGLLAYTGQGACKSLYTSYHVDTRNYVIEKRIEDGRYLLENTVKGQINYGSIVNKFYQLRSGIDDDYV